MILFKASEIYYLRGKCKEIASAGSSMWTAQILELQADWVREDGLIFSSTEPRVICNIKNVPHNLDKLLFDTTQLEEIRKCVGRFRHKSRSSVREITNVQFHCLRSQNRIQPSSKTSTRSKERKAGNPLLFKPTYDQIAKIRTEAIQKKDTCSILRQSQSSGD